MTTKTLSTYITGGYVLAARYDGLDIITTGGIGGAGGAALLLHRAATLSNLGGIHNTQTLGGGSGVEADAAATIDNGSAAVTSAYIRGYDGIHAHDPATTITNYGSIVGHAGDGVGIRLDGGGVVTNGHGFAGTIYGGNTGILAQAAATIDNFGLVRGVTLDGIEVTAGAGAVRNGSIRDIQATVMGALYGVYIASATASVVNYGTIQASRTGVELRAGGVVANGGAKGGSIDTSALIRGETNGVIAGGYSTIDNLGTIVGASGQGVFLLGGEVTNGSAAAPAALITGFRGVEGIDYRGLGTTITNFGTIAGTGGRAVMLKGGGDTVAVEAGCAFVGKVIGGGGTLNLDTGTGMLTGNLAGGTIKVSGSIAATVFRDFDTVEIGAAASFATTGAVAIATGQSVMDAGALTLGGTTAAVVNDGTIEVLGGTLTVNGAVTGAGGATIKVGLIDFASSFNQAVTFAGKRGTLELAQSQAYAAAISGFSKAGGTFLDLDDIAFVGAGQATYSGTKTGGVLTVTDGTHTAHINLVGNYRGSAFVTASDGHGGTIVHDPPAPPAAVPPPHRFIAAMAGLGVGGAELAGAADAPRALFVMLSKPAAMTA